MKIRSKLTYANMMASLAVFLMLAGGTALAAGAFTGKQKKQVGKIATKVFNARIGGASVSHAITANTANTATKASEATKAGEAIKADSATTAATAAKATSADNAETANRAADSEKFGGRIPAEYQRKLKAGCLPPGSAIAGISNEGDVTCAFPITPVSVTAAATQDVPLELGNGLRVLVVCHDGGLVELAFQNVGGATAGEIGWISGIGTGAATVGQQEMAAGSGEKDFLFVGTSVQTHIVYSIGTHISSIDVSARDLTSSCEVRGTEQNAS
ncbi:MAG TPA: hypothetical protein VIJ21_09130 [Solirubrobacterales bacterium]